MLAAIVILAVSTLAVSAVKNNDAQAQVTWTFCADEGNRCNFSGTKQVRYGKNSTWTAPQNFTNEVFCDNSVFGDPLINVRKECQTMDILVSPPPPPPPPPPPLTGAKPYFRATNGSVFAGGGFDDAQANPADPSESCRAAYEAPDYSTPGTTQYNAAIMTWANSDRNQSSGSNLDAFALGLIEGDTGPDYGFYTGNLGTSALSFNNVKDFGVSAFWGGMFEGGNLQAHCIPDYYTTKRNGSPTSINNWNGVNYASDFNQFQFSGASGPNLTGGSDRVIPIGKKLAIFAGTDVYIDSNITYEPGYKVTNIPKFVLVIKGHALTINPNVTRLDGWYILIPQATGNAGQLFTCNDATQPISDKYIRANCGKNLAINGAVIAQQLKLDRINGDLGGPSAEDITYTPENVLGGSFFDDDSGSNSGGDIQSLISLPPVF